MKIKEEIPRLVALYEKGELKLDELVSRHYAFDEVNEAMDATRWGEGLRNVVTDARVLRGVVGSSGSWAPPEEGGRVLAALLPGEGGSLAKGRAPSAPPSPMRGSDADSTWAFPRLFPSSMGEYVFLSKSETAPESS